MKELKWPNNGFNNLIRWVRKESSDIKHGTTSREPLTTGQNWKSQEINTTSPTIGQYFCLSWSLNLRMPRNQHKQKPLAGRTTHENQTTLNRSFSFCISTLVERNSTQAMAFVLGMRVDPISRFFFKVSLWWPQGNFKRPLGGIWETVLHWCDLRSLYFERPLEEFERPFWFLKTP